MVTTNIKQSALPAIRPERKAIPPRFAGGANVVWQAESEAVIRGLKQARLAQEKLFSAKLFNTDVRKGGLSLEDVAGRLQTLLGIYLLQGYYAVKDDKHPWETNGRNAMIWVMTLLLQHMTKSESYGVNTLLFNPFMRQKGVLSSENTKMQNFLDRYRMKVDYLDILQDSGISINTDDLKGARTGKKALWAASWLDGNKADLIKKRFEALENMILQSEKDTDKYQKLLTDAKARQEFIKAATHVNGSTGETLINGLSKEQSAIYQSIPKFFRRINGLNLASTGLIMGATIYLIGGVAMDIVNKVISPLDKDYQGNKKKKPGEPQKPSLFAKSHPPSPNVNEASYHPTQFKYFPSHSAYPNSSYPAQSHPINFNAQQQNNQTSQSNPIPGITHNPSVSNLESSPIQFFQSYVSHRRQSTPTLPGGIY